MWENGIFQLIFRRRSKKVIKLKNFKSLSSSPPPPTMFWIMDPPLVSGNGRDGVKTSRMLQSTLCVFGFQQLSIDMVMVGQFENENAAATFKKKKTKNTPSKSKKL